MFALNSSSFIRAWKRQVSSGKVAYVFVICNAKLNKKIKLICDNNSQARVYIHVCAKTKSDCKTLT